MCNPNKFIITLFLLGFISAQDYSHTKIQAIPDLSFMKDVYTGLDILEQMDFSQLKGKTLSILCNQASVNFTPRSGRCSCAGDFSAAVRFIC